MELEQFITATLKDIVHGLKNANKELGGSDKFKIIHHGEVSFDIAITVTEESAGGGEAGIHVYALKLGGKKENSSINENVSRIKFKVSADSNIS
jgi:hypothetical protein